MTAGEGKAMARLRGRGVLKLLQGLAVMAVASAVLTALGVERAAIGAAQSDDDIQVVVSITPPGETEFEEPLPTATETSPGTATSPGPEPTGSGSHAPRPGTLPWTGAVAGYAGLVAVGALLAGCAGVSIRRVAARRLLAGGQRDA
jgi:hypothetical protein